MAKRTQMLIVKQVLVAIEFIGENDGGPGVRLRKRQRAKAK